MKTIRILSICFLACFIGTQLIAQKGGYEYIQQKRVKFLVLNLDLSIEESQQFWPVYNEYSAKKAELSESYKKDYGDFKKFEGATEEEHRRVVEGMIENRISQAALLKTYTTRYLEVLSAKKVYRLFTLEEEFNKNLMKQLRKPPAAGPKKGKGNQKR